MLLKPIAEPTADLITATQKPVKGLKVVVDSNEEDLKPNGKRQASKSVYSEEGDSEGEDVIEYEEDTGAQEDMEYQADEDDEDDDDFIIEREVKRTPRKLAINHGASTFDDHDDGFD